MKRFRTAWHIGFPPYAAGIAVAGVYPMRDTMVFRKDDLPLRQRRPTRSATNDDVAAEVGSEKAVPIVSPAISGPLHATAPEEIDRASVTLQFKPG